MGQFRRVANLLRRILWEAERREDAISYRRSVGMRFVGFARELASSSHRWILRVSRRRAK